MSVFGALVKILRKKSKFASRLFFSENLVSGQ